MHIEKTDIGPRAFSAENKSNSPCFFCSMKRRKRLFERCKDYGLTHLAFGHTADDLVTTFFMNMFNGGRVEAMRSSEPFFEGRLQVIRPMLLVEKQVVIRAARAWGLPVSKNPCPASTTSRRSQVDGWLSDKWSEEPKARRNAFNALRRWQLDLDMKLPYECDDTPSSKSSGFKNNNTD
jgi:tRNA(Ile)-lysidine synthase TilS/MesJ